MEEVWKDIEDYKGIYQISNHGRIKSNYRKTPTILKPQIDGKGYPQVSLYKNKKVKHMLVHRLLAKHFIPNLDNKPHINHIDGNKTNFKMDNLEWCTHQENMIHKEETGLGLGIPIIATNIDTGEEIEFRSHEHAARELNLSRGNFTKHLNGKSTRVGRYTFRKK